MRSLSYKASMPLLISVLVAACFSCTRKSASFEPTDPLGIDNKWVYDSLKLYYYWSDQMTGKPDYSLPTSEFFRRLLSPNDRFSWMGNGSTVSAPKTTAELFGFQYSLINHPFQAQQLAGVVTLVAPDSYAGRNHWRRGMFFTRINDKIITPQNMQALITELQSNNQAMLQLAALNNDGSALVDSIRVAVQSGYVRPRCVYATRLFEHPAGKTGYLAYFGCVENEDQLLLESIQKCKNAAVTELILDLRYNGGGSMQEAVCPNTM